MSQVVKIFQFEFLKAMREHKILTKGIADGKYLDSNGAIAKHAILGEELALILAKFKCEADGCNDKENLTIHHLISRRNKGLIAPNKYISQRHYFFNIAILCRIHHNQVDRERNNDPKGIISKKNIEETKERYGIIEEDLIEIQQAN